jgi:putative oxidoreductase
MNDTTRYLPFAGRVLIGAVFLMSGLGKLAAYAATTAMIAAAGLPVPPAAWLIAVVVEAGGGLLLLLGFRTRAVALILAAFAVATALAFHRNFGDQNQMIHFLKNLIIAGGLLQIAHFGAGAVGLDNRRKAQAGAAPLVV